MFSVISAINDEVGRAHMCPTCSRPVHLIVEPLWGKKVIHKLYYVQAVRKRLFF